MKFKLKYNWTTFQMLSRLGKRAACVPVLNKMALRTKHGRRSRGYLPHFDGGELSQFITTRLSDSLPQNVLSQWRSELEKEEINDVEFRKKIEHYLDQSYGEYYLKDSQVAEIVRENLLHHRIKNTNFMLG